MHVCVHTCVYVCVCVRTCAYVCVGAWRLLLLVVGTALVVIRDTGCSDIEKVCCLVFRNPVFAEREFMFSLCLVYV